MAGLLGNIGRWFRGETGAAAGVASALPPYVERDDDWCRCHPGSLEGVTACLFPLKTDWSKLDALCETLFRKPSNQEVDVKPFSNGVVIGMFEYKRASSTNEPDWGYLGY